MMMDRWREKRAGRKGVDELRDGGRQERDVRIG